MISSQNDACPDSVPAREVIRDAGCVRIYDELHFHYFETGDEEIITIKTPN